MKGKGEERREGIRKMMKAKATLETKRKKTCSRQTEKGNSTKIERKQEMRHEER